MAQVGLDCPQIRAIAQKPGRRRVAQTVRQDMLFIRKTRNGFNFPK